MIHYIRQEVPEVSRDLDLVLLTGAGASRNLANPPFPLMGDWAKALTQHLGNTPYLNEAVGIQGVTDGQKFEERLGKFLAETAAFRSSRDLIIRSAHFPFVAPAFADPQGLSDWCDHVEAVLSSSVRAIHESLVAEFGSKYYNSITGPDVYRRLLGALRINQQTSTWVYATKNTTSMVKGFLTTLALRLTRPNRGIHVLRRRAG